MAFFDSQVSKAFVAEYDLASYLTEIRGLPGPRNMNPATTLADAGVKHHPSLQEPAIDLTALWDNTAVLGLDELLAVLRSDTSGKNFSYYPEGYTFEAYGYGAGLSLLANYTVNSRVGNLIEATANLPVQGKSERIRSLFPLTTVVATTNGSGHDDLAGGSGAEVAMFYHVTAWSASGGNAQWKIRIEDDDNSGFTTPATAVTATIAAIGGAKVVAATALQRYHRAVIELDATSGSITVQVGYIPITGNDDW